MIFGSARLSQRENLSIGENTKMRSEINDDCGFLMVTDPGCLVRVQRVKSCTVLVSEQTSSVSESTEGTKDRNEFMV